MKIEPVAYDIGGHVCHDRDEAEEIAYTCEMEITPLYAIPDDMIIVPREPTEAMVKAGIAATMGAIERNETGHDFEIDIYTAMIEAAGVDDADNL